MTTRSDRVCFNFGGVEIFLNVDRDRVNHGRARPRSGPASLEAEHSRRVKDRDSSEHDKVYSTPQKWHSPL